MQPKQKLGEMARKHYEASRIKGGKVGGVGSELGLNLTMELSRLLGGGGGELLNHNPGLGLGFNPIAELVRN